MSNSTTGQQSAYSRFSISRLRKVGVMRGTQCLASVQFLTLPGRSLVETTQRTREIVCVSTALNSSCLRACYCTIPISQTGQSTVLTTATRSKRMPSHSCGSSVQKPGTDRSKLILQVMEHSPHNTLVHASFTESP